MRQSPFRPLARGVRPLVVHRLLVAELLAQLRRHVVGAARYVGLLAAGDFTVGDGGFRILLVGVAALIDGLDAFAAAVLGIHAVASGCPRGADGLPLTRFSDDPRTGSCKPHSGHSAGELN